MAYVLDTLEEGKNMVADGLIIRDYPNVFPKDFPGVPRRGKSSFGLTWF